MILVVEDDTEIRRAVCSILVNEGYLVEQASSGLEAMEKLRKTPGKYGLILMDVSMPGLDGNDVLFMLREEKIPVAIVVFTAGKGDSIDESVGDRNRPIDVSELLRAMTLWQRNPKSYKHKDGEGFSASGGGKKIKGGRN